MAEWKIWSVIILATHISMVTADKKTCNQKLRCNECIVAHPDCAWCKSTDFLGTRCSTRYDLTINNCGNITQPMNSDEFIKNDPLRNGSEKIDPIQLSPQHIRLQLKPGQKYHLDMKYMVAKNLPIDMYFVLDFSVTMKNRIQDLADLTSELIQGLRDEFTENIHIGFGSFMDKPVQPFTITVPAQLENPCILDSSGKCDRAYGYIHRWKLNSDIKSFVDTIKNANTSANFDPMEGGLDALLQASVCPDVIGWRNQSRRVLIHISDGGFHFAGDGKLAGIDQPNDGLCHMNQRKEHTEQYIYTRSENLDYPSFGQIKNIFEENRINAFFLASKDDIKTYESLTEFIGPQADTQVMDTQGASKIITNIKDFYTELSSNVKIAAVDIPDGINVIAETNCGHGGINSTFVLRKESIKCSRLQQGKEVFINVTVQANECPKDKNTKSMFKLIPSGLQESLTVEIGYICDCECPQTDEMDNKHCSLGNGTYECGVCKCNEGRSGEICQCNIEEDSSETSINEANCKKNNESSICEDRGSCKCGQCICSTNFDGKFCECDTSACIAPGATVKCTGIDQGDCVCGKCVCKNDYHGEYCECPPQSNCLGDNNLVCSGNGQCSCGKCECKTGYNGTHCEDCPRCAFCTKCGNEEQQQCAQCLNKNNIQSNDTATDCGTECSGLNIIFVEKFREGIQPCDMYVSENCKVNYIIQCSDNMINLHYTTKEQCVIPPDPLYIVMPILGGIIGVGFLLLLIWKLLTMFYDTIEYAKFEHEIQHPKWSKTDNPIYKTATTSNQNPAFKGSLE